VIQIRGLDTTEFTQKLAAAYNAVETKHRKAQETLAEGLQAAQKIIADRTERVGQLERSFIGRLTRRFR
jgi:hypothetical protein